jgi:hypothetical protein
MAARYGAVSVCQGGVFIRGFLAAFSREVGLDPALVVADFAATQAPTPMPAHARPVEPAQPNLVVRHIVWTLTATVFLVALAWLVPQSKPTAEIVADVTPDQEATITPAFMGPEPTLATFTQTDSSDEALTDLADRLILALRAVDTVWLEAAINGESKIYRLLQASEEERLSANGEIALLVGDAAALRYWINGMPGRRLGDRGQVREIHITPENYRSFLATDQEAVHAGA